MNPRSMDQEPTEALAVVVEREIPFPTEKVWRALTQPHLIEEWLMKNDFKPAVGHRFQLRGDWGGVLDCEVLAIEPNKKLAYTWNFAHDDAAYNLQSVVTFTVTPTSTGTHLRMEQSGFRKDQKQAFGGAKAGWQQFLANLEQVLARTAMSERNGQQDVQQVEAGRQEGSRQAAEDGAEIAVPRGREADSPLGW